MTIIKYIGPQDGLFIPHNDLHYEVERDGEVDVPDDLAKQLLKRPDFKAATTKQQASKPDKKESN